MGWMPENTTFVSSWNPTFVNGRYISIAHNIHYVKLVIRRLGHALGRILRLASLRPALAFQ